MPGAADHTAPALDDLTATEALAVVLGELRTLREEVRRLQPIAAEVDRLRTRIQDPTREELTLAETAAELGMSERWVRGQAKAFERGDTTGLRGRKNQAGEWRFLRLDVEAFRNHGR